MEKTYVLDTSVLLQTPYALEAFEDNQIVLPIAVLEELDALKGAEGEQGTNARQAIRRLEALRAQGNLLSGVPLPNGGWLRVETNCVDVPLPTEFPGYPNHRRILQVCQALRASQSRVVLVTKNILLRIKAQILGLPAEDFTSEQAPVSADQYTGRCQVFVSEKKFEAFPKKAIDPEDVYQTNELGERKPVDLVCNQFVILRADQSSKKTQLGRFDGKKIVPLAYKKKKPYGISPRNVGQYFLQEALMTGAEEAPLVIVKGMAGTAKTFYSLAVGLEKVLNHPTGEYRRILVIRPNAQFDSDIGFLPGDEQEKLSPLMRPVVDNLEQLIDSSEEERYADEELLSGKVEEIFARGLIQTEALNYIRGRSIARTYMIIDEAQNTTPDQIKGIITRAGKDTKIILLGDPGQIDRPFLDERTNGLSYASERMKGSPLCWQITMTAEECERSELALDAIRRL